MNRRTFLGLSVLVIFLTGCVSPPGPIIRDADSFQGYANGRIVTLYLSGDSTLVVEGVRFSDDSVHWNGGSAERSRLRQATASLDQIWGVCFGLYGMPLGVLLSAGIGEAFASPENMGHVASISLIATIPGSMYLGYLFGASIAPLGVYTP